MGRRLLSAAVAAAFVALAGVVSVAPAAPKHPKGDAVPNELIVGFRPDASAKDEDKALRKAGVKVKKEWGKLHAELGSADDVHTAVKLLADDPAVRYAQPNYTLYAAALPPNDPSFGQLWALHNTGQSVNGTTGTAGADIGVLSAWASRGASRASPSP